MYIIIEGIDGSGKDSQAELLTIRLAKEDGRAQLVAEPNMAMPGGELLRQLLKSGEYVEAHPGLFLANRMALQTAVVKPVMNRGDSVVSVRSFVSTLVYQQEDWPLDWLFEIHRELPVKPNLIIVLDLPAEVGLERTAKRSGHTEYYERRETLERVRQRYIQLVNPDRRRTGPKLHDFVAPGGQIHLLDASGSIKQVSETIWGFVQEVRETLRP